MKVLLLPATEDKTGKINNHKATKYYLVQGDWENYSTGSSGLFIFTNDKHGTVVWITALIFAIYHNSTQNFLDASGAFDQIHHDKVFHEMSVRRVLKYLLRTQNTD